VTNGVRRILMTTDAVGGVWRYAVDLAAALAERDVEVVLAVLGPPPSADQVDEALRVEGLVLEVLEGRLEWMASPWDDVDRHGEALLRIAAATRPDVVHLNGYAHGALPWRKPVLVAAHSCVASWWEAVHGTPTPRAYGEYRRRVRAGLAAADDVVAPSRAMLDALRRHHLPTLQGRVIPNGIVPERYRRERKTPLVACVGRVWDEAKRVAAVDRVAAGLPWRVCVAGDLRDPVTGLERPLHHVEALGAVPHERVVELLAAASIYVHPARYEPFGLSVLEAAASGCALVLADLPSLRETWGDAALYVDPGDEGALRRALRRLVDEAPVRALLASRASARAERLTAARSAEAYLEAYRDVRPAGVIA
jgi:glycosyltransferase involved in cell wall biosynthesis